MIYGMIHRLGILLKERGAKRALARALDKPESVISDLCSGKDRLNDDLIERICAALKIPIWQLFADPRDVLPPEYLKWQDAYSRLDEHRRIIVDDMLKAALHTEPDKENSLKKTKKLHTGV